MSIKIQDLSSNHRYRTELPNIIFEIGLSPTLIGVYSALKRCAGDNGNCTKSERRLAKELNTTPKTLRNWIYELTEVNSKLNKPLIFLQKRFSEYGDKDTNCISITDLWPDNAKYFNDLYGGEVKITSRGVKFDPREVKITGGVGEFLPDGGVKITDKEEPIKKNLIEEEHISRGALKKEKVVGIDFVNENFENSSSKLEGTQVSYKLEQHNVYNQTTNSIETETKSNKKMKNEIKIEQITEDKLSFGEEGNVKLTQKEYEKLLNKMTEVERNEWIETIDLEVGKQGKQQFDKKYKSHYSTILSWKRWRDKKNPNPIPPTLEKQEVKSDPKQQKLIQENKTFSKEFTHKITNPKVVYTPRDECLEIKFKRDGMHDKFCQFFYSRHDFQKQVIEFLRECKAI